MLLLEEVLDALLVALLLEWLELPEDALALASAPVLLPVFTPPGLTEAKELL